jgi:hypothetical protein
MILKKLKARDKSKVIDYDIYFYQNNPVEFINVTLNIKKRENYNESTTIKSKRIIPRA